MKRKRGIAALVAGAVIVLGLLAGFAVELSDNQAKSRRDVEGRVHDRAVLASALIDSLFQTSASTTIQAYQRTFGTPIVTEAEMNKSRSGNEYAVLLDSADQIIAASRGFGAQGRSDLRISATLKLLRAGRPWALGDVLPYGKTGVINFGLTLNTSQGTRYLLVGFSPKALGPLLLGELRQIPGVKGSYSSLVDGAGIYIASTNPKRPPGYRIHTTAQLRALHSRTGILGGRYFDNDPLPGTSWRLFLSSPTGPLFAEVSGLRKWVPWIIFIAFGIVALLALLLVRRAIGDSERVTAVNAQLTGANQQLAGAKDRLEQLNGQLSDVNHALARSNDELERQAKELVRSNSELDQFASIASHDLQEPLRKVRTFTERVVESEADGLSERGRDYLHRANASAARMQTLIEDLLRYSRVSSQSRPFTAVDLQLVVDEVLDDLSEQIASTGAVVRVGELPTISADPPQMRQLLQNLVSNALKFRQEDVTPEIDVRAVMESGWVTLTVRDNGIGFDPQYSRRIFRVFERLHGRGAYPGTGIGLALCRKIAERHGGTIVARSAPGEGATFTVTLQTQRTEAVSDTPHVDEPHTAEKEPYVAA